MTRQISWWAFRHEVANDRSPEVKTGDILQLLDSLELAADRIACLTKFIEETGMSPKWVGLGKKYEEEARKCLE